MSLLDLCKEMVAYAKNGDPVKDVIENSEYREDELLVLLAKHYIKTNKPTKRSVD
jgi:hypothetical protein